MATFNITKKEIELLNKLSPWLDSCLKGSVIQEEDPQKKHVNWLKPEHPLGFTNHPKLTFGDIKEIHQLITTLSITHELLQGEYCSFEELDEAIKTANSLRNELEVVREQLYDKSKHVRQLNKMAESDAIALREMKKRHSEALSFVSQAKLELKQCKNSAKLSSFLFGMIAGTIIYMIVLTFI